jgi:hypothetical protein
VNSPHPAYRPPSPRVATGKPRLDAGRRGTHGLCGGRQIRRACQLSGANLARGEPTRTSRALPSRSHAAAPGTRGEGERTACAEEGGCVVRANCREQTSLVASQRALPHPGRSHASPSPKKQERHRRDGGGERKLRRRSVEGAASGSGIFRVRESAGRRSADSSAPPVRAAPGARSAVDSPECWRLPPR